MKIGAIFVTAILLVLNDGRPAVAAPPPLEACPYYVGAIGPSATENVTGIVLGSNNGRSAAVSVVLYTHTSSYVLNAKVPGFGETYYATYRGAGYHSSSGEHLSIPILFTTPTDGPIEAAYVQPPTHAQAVMCGAQPYVVQEAGAVQPAPSELQRISTAQADASNSPATLAFRATEDNFTCSAPYAATRILRAMPPEYPMSIDGTPPVGVTVISILLDETGRVIGAAVFESSHSDALDRAATVAAKASSYSAAVFRCRPVAGSYRFRAEFSAQSTPGFHP